MHMVKSVRYILLGAAVVSTGCVKQQTYTRPPAPVPQAWHAPADKTSADAPPAAEVKWREFFHDSRLQSVIELALSNNRDLRMAALNIEKAQAAYRIRRAEQYPTVSAAAGGDAYRQPAKMSKDGTADTVGQITLGVGISNWELDLFGRIRSLKTAALEQYLATEQARASTQIALTGAVASSYLTLAADRSNLRLARETLETQQSTYKLIARTREAGMASDLELRQAQSQVEAARVEIARYSGYVAADENALNLLVGAPVPSNLLPAELGTDESLKDVSAGLSSDVLLKRPDILMAEHQLKAAYANIGAARAAYFPRITLTAALGLMSGDLTNLFEYGSRTWNFAPQAGVPIFDSGARRANVRIAEVDRDLAVAEYEKAIQAAFREVSDSLSLRRTLRDQQSAQQELVRSLEETYRLSDARYKAGIDSYLSVLVAQRSLFAARQGLVSLRMARMGNLVTLYKVLGGGV